MNVRTDTIAAMDHEWRTVVDIQKRMGFCWSIVTIRLRLKEYENAGLVEIRAVIPNKNMPTRFTNEYRLREKVDA